MRHARRASMAWLVCCTVLSAGWSNAGSWQDLHNETHVRVYAKYGLVLAPPQGEAPDVPLAFEARANTTVHKLRICMRFVDLEDGRLRVSVGPELGINATASRVQMFGSRTASCSMNADVVLEVYCVTIRSGCDRNTDERRLLCVGNESLASVHVQGRSVAIDSVQMWVLHGNGTAWRFANANENSTCRQAACYTGLQAQAQRDDANLVRAWNTGDSAYEPYAPAWAYNPAGTLDGYYRRTPYKGEGGISFGNNEVARGDRVARVCTQKTEVFAVEAVQLPRVELGFDDKARCPCAAGLFRATGSCEACPAGYYIDVGNMSACVPCGRGEYAPAPNSTACTSCPVDMPTTDRVASTNRTACKRCPGDTNGPLCECEESLPFYNQTTRKCTACPSGWEFRAGGDIAEQPPAACYPCNAGSALLEGTCTLCAAGKYAPGLASTDCTHCAYGDAIQYRGETSPEACVSCLPGTFRAGTQCFECGGGRTSAGKNATRCVCPGGFAAVTPAFRAAPKVVSSTPLPPDGANATCMPQLRAQGLDSERLVAVLISPDTLKSANPDTLNPSNPIRFEHNVWVAVLHASLQLDGGVLLLQKPKNAYYWEVEPFWNSLTHRLSVYRRYFLTQVVWELLGDNFDIVAERWTDVVAVGVASASGLHVRLSDTGVLHMTTHKRAACNATYQVVSAKLSTSVHQRMFVNGHGDQVALVLDSGPDNPRATVQVVSGLACTPPADAVPVLDFDHFLNFSEIEDVQFGRSGLELIVSDRTGVSRIALRGAVTVRTVLFAHASSSSDVCNGNRTTLSQARTRLVTARNLHTVTLYEPVDGAEQCQACAPGTAAAFGAGACYSCNASAVAPASGNSTCEACAYGFRANSNRTKCVRDSACVQSANDVIVPLARLALCPCDAGFYMHNASGVLECRGCPEGTFKPKRGLLECSPCAAGYTGPIASTSDEFCVPLSCEFDAGVVFNAATAQCLCPAGAKMLVLAGGNATCVPCEQGSWRSAPSRNTTCVHCEADGAGLTTEGPGAVSPELCVCRNGTFFSHAESSCVPCPLGSFGHGLNRSQTCARCPADAPTTLHNDSVHITACVPCPQGFFANASGADTVCVKCAPGSGHAGGHACVSCPAGAYGPDLARNGSCFPCPPRTHSLRGAAQCVACAPGHAWNATPGTCSACPEGTHGEPAGRTCVPCPPNATSIRGAANSSACVCRLGTVTARNGVCRLCPPASRFQLATGNASAAQCAPCAGNALTPCACTRDQVLGNASGLCLRAACPAANLGVEHVQVRFAYTVHELLFLAETIAHVADTCLRHVQIEATQDMHVYTFRVQMPRVHLERKPVSVGMARLAGADVLLSKSELPSTPPPPSGNTVAVPSGNTVAVSSASPLQSGSNMSPFFAAGGGVLVAVLFAVYCCIRQNKSKNRVAPEPSVSKMPHTNSETAFLLMTPAFVNMQKHAPAPDVFSIAAAQSTARRHVNPSHVHFGIVLDARV